MRFFAGDLRLAAVVLAAAVLAAGNQSSNAPLTFAFTETGSRAGLAAPTVYGGVRSNRFLLETTGTGVAALDYDNDGWLDAFLVNGTTLEGFPKGKEPTSHLYRNNRDGTFEDVTGRAGLALTGWGQGACAGDYDNDGWVDSLVTFWGANRLFRNRGDGTFTETTKHAGLETTRVRWGAGCAFLDYDRDGKLDVFAANYIDSDWRRPPFRSRDSAATRACPWRAGHLDCRAGRTSSTATAATARLPTSPRRRGSRAPMAPTPSASARSISTMTGGSTSMWRTTRIPARSTATTTTARSPTSGLPPDAPTARMASRRPVWASPSAITTATG